MNKFDSIVAGSLDIAQTEALKRQHTQLEPIHLLYGLVSNPQSFSSRAFKSHKKEIKNLLEKVATLTSKISVDQLKASSKFSEWLTYASSHAIQAGKQEVSEPDLLRYLGQALPEFKFDPAILNEAHDTEEEVPSFLTNLNELASLGKLDPVIGRSKEIRAVMEILGRRGKNNPVLVGLAGVGKTAIVEGLAEAIVKGNVPDVLSDKTVMSLDMGSLMAGTKYRGEFEERLQKLIKWVKGQAGQVILFIDEMHQLVGAGRTDGAMDAANLLKPALARGDLHCIGATTPEEYQKYILGDAALDRRFRPVPVNEPSKEDAIEILTGVREKLEIHHGIKISDDAVFQSVVLSDQYITDKQLPDKAIDLIDEAASALKLSAEAMPAKLVELQAEIRSKKIYSQMNKSPELDKEIESLEAIFLEEKTKWEQEVLSVKKVSELKNQLEKYKFELEQAERRQDYEKASELKYSLIPELEGQVMGTSHDWVLSSKDIAAVISRQTGIPVDKIMKTRQENILDLESKLKERVYGQNEAIHEIAETLISSHAGLTDTRRPLGSFLLKGPSGVGKTETAKALANLLFDTEDALIRFDLSEFSEKHSVSKLIGAPAGYVGYDEGGVLTEAIRRKPYAVILFDEIEKAHRDFSDILLQILDDGRLTDNKGRTISFRNTVIIATSNSKNLELDFKPEVLGRIDAVLEYSSLGPDIMHDLVAKQVKLLNQRLVDRNLQLSLSEELIGVLSDKGYDPRYGARPLASIFNKIVLRPLAKLLLSDTSDKKRISAEWDSTRSEVVFNLG